MNDILADGLELLRRLATNKLAPMEAWEHFLAFRAQHATAQVDLIWEKADLIGATHYDLLFHGEAGTISLSWCALHDIPWPLRGVQRWRESDIVRVDGISIDVSSAMTSLQMTWRELKIGEHLVDIAIIQAEERREPIDVSDAELEAALDAFRESRGLYSIEATERWQKAAGLSDAQLSEHIYHQVTRNKLKERVCGHRVEAYLAKNAGRLDRLRIGRLRFPTQESALEARSQLASSPSKLATMALEHFLENGASEPFVELTRRALHPEVEKALCHLGPGEICSPVGLGGGYEIFCILAVSPAHATAARHEALEQLFAEWLAERRNEARIEWFWGQSEAQ